MTAPIRSDSPSKISPPIFARLYAALARGAEPRGTADHRRRLLVGLRGEVVEIGAGSGLNFAHYPQGVTHVTAIEPEPYLRQQAERAAASALIPVSVIAGAAENLPVEDGRYDAAVFSLVRCSVTEQAVALAEAHRCLKAGGELRFYEHVQAHNPHCRAGPAHSRRDLLAAHRRRLPPRERHRDRDPPIRL
jgi:SAM-dependent methyltransferase